MSPEILPSSVPREVRGVVLVDGVAHVPVYCANCGAHGPLVVDADRRFSFYLCEPCAERHGEVAGTMMVPDAVHWQMQHAEQLAKYGRGLTVEELIEVEKDGHNTLTKLARDFHTRSGR